MSSKYFFLSQYLKKSIIFTDSTLECFDEHIFPLTDVSRFIEDCLVAVGIPLVNAKILANALTKADYIGFTCDGLQQLGT